jgi:glycosyltransferase involved in cell wall biosynthesis
MIVKNKVENFPRLAYSLSGQIDHWTIVDTGSTNGTRSVAVEVFAGVPGVLLDTEWRGYGPTGNVALAAAAGHTDWLLTMGAD